MQPALPEPFEHVGHAQGDDVQEKHLELSPVLERVSAPRLALAVHVLVVHRDPVSAVGLPHHVDGAEPGRRRVARDDAPLEVEHQLRQHVAQHHGLVVSNRHLRWHRVRLERRRHRRQVSDLVLAQGQTESVARRSLQDLFQSLDCAGWRAGVLVGLLQLGLEVRIRLRLLLLDWRLEESWGLVARQSCVEEVGPDDHARDVRLHHQHGHVPDVERIFCGAPALQRGRVGAEDDDGCDAE